MPTLPGDSPTIAMPTLPAAIAQSHIAFEESVSKLDVSPAALVALLVSFTSTAEKFIAAQASPSTACRACACTCVLVPPTINHQSSPSNTVANSTTYAGDLYRCHWGPLMQLIDVAQPTELELSLDIIANSYEDPTTLDPILLGTQLLKIAGERTMQDVKDAHAAALVAISVDEATATLVPAASTPVGITPPPVDFSVIIPLLEQIAERQAEKLRQAASRLARKVAQSERVQTDWCPRRTLLKNFKRTSPLRSWRLYLLTPW